MAVTISDGELYVTLGAGAGGETSLSTPLQRVALS
jgi:hypothetical protein